MITIAEATRSTEFEMLKKYGATDKTIYCFVPSTNERAMQLARDTFMGFMVLDVGSGIIMEKILGDGRKPMTGFFV